MNSHQLISFCWLLQFFSDDTNNFIVTQLGQWRVRDQMLSIAAQRNVVPPILRYDLEVKADNTISEKRTFQDISGIFCCFLCKKCEIVFFSQRKIIHRDRCFLLLSPLTHSPREKPNSSRKILLETSNVT